MKWTEDTPALGDIIRVKVNFYYHYGIFADEDTVIQFGYPDNTGVNPEDIKVLTTDIHTFLSGGMIETARLSPSEKAKRRSPEETVKYAMSKLGTDGYHILHNNCEHFVNDCVFGVSKSDFVDDVRAKIRNKLKNIKERV